MNEKMVGLVTIVGSVTPPETNLSMKVRRANTFSSLMYCWLGESTVDDFRLAGTEDRAVETRSSPANMRKCR